MPHSPYNFTQEQLDCEAEREWPVFIYSILITFATLLLLVLLYKMLAGCCRKVLPESPVDTQLGSSSFSSEIQEWAEGITSGQTPSGRMLVVAVFFCNVVAMVLYIIDTSRQLLEECITWEEHITLQIDFALGAIFFLHFLLRFVASEKVMSFLFALNTIVDVITLPPLFVSLWIQRTWLGLRFFRFLIIFSLPDVLVYVRLLQNSSSIRLTQLLSYVLGFMCWSGGFLFLLENQGDPFHDYENARERGSFRFGDNIWFLIITASTVGYGDFFPVTDLGKIFGVFYLGIGVGSFASFIPEIAELLGNQPKYAGNYVASAEKQFIIVCGNITYSSVSGFLADFFHPAREDVNCEVVFLNKLEPDLEFEGLLKREKTRVTYFQGTMLSAMDLQRVCAEKAAAVLVMCDKFSTDPTREDASNIMRVISLKNYCEGTRCVIQLLHYHNKSYLLNIPGWDWRRDDQAVCLNEVKFGMLAQSCLAPGFFTMASNIITASLLNIMPEMPKWKKEYLSTSNKVILAETFSPTFVGLTFQEVAEIVYLRLNLVLIAMEARKYEGGQIWINPRNRKITPNAIGLFITASSDAAKRAWFYCRVCHEHVEDVEEVKKCSCKRLAKARYEYFNYGKENPDQRNGFSNRQELKQKEEPKEGLRKRKKSLGEADRARSETAKMRFDGTGCFHWCGSQAISDCTLTRQDATVTMFAGHIVIAIFAEDENPVLGLRNLVMPLRASNIPYGDLRHIIVLGNMEFIKREWKLLANMPKISVMDGSPSNRADLRAVKVNLCRTCVILSAKAPDKTEPVLADKEIIMAALNIKSMKFGGSFLTDEDDDDMDEEEDPEMNHVNLLLDLSFVSNVRYLDDQEMHMSDHLELYKTLPFASGTAMAKGILDSLMSATYFNASALKLLRQLVTGGATIELEKSLAEGAGLRGGYSTPEVEAAKNRIRVDEIVLRESQWSRYAEYGARFSDLFSAAIKEQGTLCLAINRLLAEDYEDDGDLTRVVISCPDNLMTLQPMDNIIAVVQYEEDKEKRE